MIEHHTIPVTKTAHYYTIGTPGKHVQYCWIACHGYGQLAQYFIRKFDVIAKGDTLIIAPEGLSRFYTEGLSGKVGASWMTKEDRLLEIEDYTNYLTTLYNYFIPQLADNVQIILLGFSQGCATQMRWITRAFPAFHHLILWAGLVPEDLNYLSHQHYFADKKLHFIYGTEDPFITPERLQQHEQLIDNQQLKLEISTYQGAHSIDRAALQQLAAGIYYP
ncbi:MAG: alpha/beta hydrolase [Saprospiraceae bacterium]